MLLALPKHDEYPQTVVKYETPSLYVANNPSTKVRFSQSHQLLDHRDTLTKLTALNLSVPNRVAFLPGSCRSNGKSMKSVVYVFGEPASAREARDPLNRCHPRDVTTRAPSRWFLKIYSVPPSRSVVRPHTLHNSAPANGIGHCITCVRPHSLFTYPPPSS